MGRYLIRRIINIVPTLLIIALIVFVVTRMIPGDPAATLLGPQASVADVERMREIMGLNDSIFVQFFNYLGDLLRGDLGYSYAYNMNVTQLIAERFPNTIILSLAALFIALIIGIPAGIASAYYRNTPVDYGVMLISLVGVSMPVFWLGVMLVLIFSVNLGWLPATGMGSSTATIGENLQHLILPSVTLATIPMANFARITRSSMLEVISTDYVRTARAKGLREWTVIIKHALRNALSPILSIFGIQIAGLLGGSILTETIFSWPGMGRLTTDAIDRRDLAVIQGVVIFIALIYVVTNLLIDILYKVADPRITYTTEGK